MLLDYVYSKNDGLTRKIAQINDFLAFRSGSEDNLAEDIIREKLTVQRASITQIVHLILEREKFKQGNISSLESEIQGFQSKLSLYKCRLYPIELDNKRKGTLEKMISDLEKRQKQEDTDCWKDTLELWQELLKLAAEYKAALRKSKILLPEE
jgi:hypothetical protein